LSENPLSPDFVETRRIFVKLMASTGHRFDLLWNNREGLLATWNRSVEASEALKDMKSQDAMNMLPPKAKALSKLFAYLGLVESLGATLIDMTLMLLIANGIEMHIRKEGGIMHVSNLKDLRRLNLVYKLGFLDENKLKFVSGIVDRQLRNDIAHLKFRVEESGEVKGSNEKTVNVDEILIEFWKKVGQIISIFDHIRFLQFMEQGRVEDGKQNALRPT